MKKLIALSLLLFALVTLVALPTLAADAPLASDASTEITPDATAPDATAPETESALQGTDASATPFTDALASFFTESGGTLLSALTLLSSLLVALLYKRGLLPLVRSALSGIADTAEKAATATKQFTGSAEEALAAMEEKNAPLLDMAKQSAEAVAAVESALAELSARLSAAEKDRRKTAEVLLTETTLFYEMLHAVNLPETQKESMSESYYRLKRMLETEE